MSNGPTTRWSLDHEMPETDWSRFDALTDEEIERAVADDADAPPLLDDASLATARVVHPPAKVAVTLPLDQDVARFFRATDSKGQARIKALLRAAMDRVKKAG